MSKLFFVRATISPEGLKKEIVEREVEKETEKQFKLGKRERDMPYGCILNKKDLGNIHRGSSFMKINKEYYAYCLEEDIENTLEECVARIMNELQDVYDRVFPLLKPMKDAGYPIKEME